jgi:hypothetical protein
MERNVDPETLLSRKLETKLRTLSKEQLLEILEKHGIKVFEPETATKESIVMIPIFDIPLDKLEKTLENY